MRSKEKILAWLKMGNSELVGLGDLLVVILQTFNIHAEVCQKQETYV